MGNGEKRGAVFVQTNEADANRVLMFPRNADGGLSQPESRLTGGRGDGVHTSRHRGRSS